MPHQKSRSTTLRFRPAEDDALDAVAAALQLDRSSAIRFLVFEKARELGLPLPPARALGMPLPPDPPEGGELTPRKARR